MGYSPFDSAVSPPLTLREMHSLVASEFYVEASMFEFDVPIFIVHLRDSSKEAFEHLVHKMKPYGLMPFLRRRAGRTVIQVFPKPQRKPGRGGRLPLILFLVTFGTIFASGYFNSVSWAELFGEDVFIHSLYFTAALLGIVGLHELGHKTLSMRRGLEATVPYFIPGPPFPIGFGTFGAVIMQKEPPINRDQLFELGISGPLTGFAVTLVVAYLSLQTAHLVDEAFLKQLEAQGAFLLEMPPSLAWLLLSSLVNPEAPLGYVALVPPIGLAAWLGFVITFLNLLPIWQLDGGHIANAMFGEKGHRVASMAGMLIAFATGFWFFGLLILFLMAQGRGIGPLDEVSPLSPKKKVLGVLAYVILALSAVILW